MRKTCMAASTTAATASLRSGMHDLLDRHAEAPRRRQRAPESRDEPDVADAGGAREPGVRIAVRHQAAERMHAAASDVKRQREAQEHRPGPLCRRTVEERPAEEEHPFAP